MCAPLGFNVCSRPVSTDTTDALLSRGIALSGGARYTTPQLGDVRPVIRPEIPEKPCYSVPADNGKDVYDPDSSWMQTGTWCCDDFPRVERCEGEIDWDEYPRTVENTYAASLRERGTCPPKSDA